MCGSGSPLPFTTPCVRDPANIAPTPLSLSLISKTCEVFGSTSTIFPTIPSDVITLRFTRNRSRSPRFIKSVCEVGSALDPITCAASICASGCSSRNFKIASSRPASAARLSNSRFRIRSSSSSACMLLFSERALCSPTYPLHAPPTFDVLQVPTRSIGVISATAQYRINRTS